MDPQSSQLGGTTDLQATPILPSTPSSPIADSSGVSPEFSSDGGRMDSSEVNNASPKSSPLTLIAWVLIGVSVLALVAYFAGTKYLSSQKPAVTPMATASPTTSTTPDPTTNWKTYTIKSLGLSYRLPPEIISVGDLKEYVIPGETGTQLLISTENSKVIADKKLLMGTTSVDYTAGRGGMFIDLQGFERSGDQYLTKFVQNRTFVIPGNLVVETKGSDLEIIRILGKNYSSGEYLGPKEGTPGNGYLGALLNIPDNQKYTGLAIQMKLDDKLTVELFDQILSTFKFTQ